MAKRNARIQQVHEAAEVPLDVQNAMRIKRLEEQLNRPRLETGSSPGLDVKIPSPFCERNQINSAGSPPSSRPSIGEAANRIHDRLDSLHSLIDQLSDRLNSVSTAYPKVPPNAQAQAAPTACGHMAVLEGAADRVVSANMKLNAILDNLMV